MPISLFNTNKSQNAEPNQQELLEQLKALLDKASANSTPEGAAQPAPEPKPTEEPKVETPAPTPVEELKEEPKAEAPVPMPNDLAERLEKIEKMIGEELQAARTATKAVQDKLDDRQQKYEDLMQKSQEDRYRKDKAKLINKMIFYVDLMRRTLYEFRNKPEAGINLEEQLDKLIVSMDDTLSHEMVRTLPMANPGDDIVDERMEVIDSVETEDPALDNKIYRSISACYTWSLPYVLKARLDEKGDEVRTYNFVLHPEEVIIYKLKK